MGNCWGILLFFIWAWDLSKCVHLISVYSRMMSIRGWCSLPLRDLWLHFWVGNKTQTVIWCDCMFTSARISELLGRSTTPTVETCICCLTARSPSWLWRHLEATACGWQIDSAMLWSKVVVCLAGQRLSAGCADHDPWPDFLNFKKWKFTLTYKHFFICNITLIYR